MHAPLALADLTVSISTIGRLDLLEQAIDSIIEVEPPGPTLQIVLNAPPDGTRERLESRVLPRWPGPWRVFETPSRLAITASHQFALDRCTTPLINFMGDDDLCLAPRFERALQLFNSIPELTAVSSWARRAAGVERVNFGGYIDLGPATLEEWRRAQTKGEPIRYCFPAAIFKADAVRSVGGCEDRWGNAFDIGISTRLGCRTPALALTDHPFAFRIHEGSMSHQDSEALNQQSDYVLHCLTYFRAGEQEPTFEQYLRQSATTPLLTRLVKRQRMLSRKYFRVAGARWVSGRRGPAVIAAGASFAAWPAAFVRKLYEQRGRADWRRAVNRRRR